VGSHHPTHREITVSGTNAGWIRLRDRHIHDDRKSSDQPLLTNVCRNSNDLDLAIGVVDTDVTPDRVDPPEESLCKCLVHDRNGWSAHAISLLEATAGNDP